MQWLYWQHRTEYLPNMRKYTNYTGFHWKASCCMEKHWERKHSLSAFVDKFRFGSMRTVTVFLISFSASLIFLNNQIPLFHIMLFLATATLRLGKFLELSNCPLRWWLVLQTDARTRCLNSTSTALICFYIHCAGAVLLLELP